MYRRVAPGSVDERALVVQLGAQHPACLQPAEPPLEEEAVDRAHLLAPAEEEEAPALRLQRVSELLPRRLLRHLAEELEDPGGDPGVLACSLDDLGEGMREVVFEPERRHEDAGLARRDAAVAASNRRGLPHHVAQEAPQLVDRHHRRGGIVDAGREPLQRDVDELPHREEEILPGRPLAPQGEGCPDVAPGRRLQRRERPDRRERHPLEDEVAGMRLDPDHAALRRDLAELLLVHEHEVARAAGPDQRRGALRQLHRRIRPELDGAQIRPGAFADRGAELARLDRFAQVVDEIGHEREVGDGQHDPEGEGEGGHEAGVVVGRGLHRAEHEEEVGHAADEDAEDQLRGPVGHEAPQHPGRVLPRGELQRHHGEREDDAEDGGERTCRRAEDLVGTFGGRGDEGLHEGLLRCPQHRRLPVEPGQQEPQGDAEAGEHHREQPEAARHPFEEPGGAHAHATKVGAPPAHPPARPLVG